MIRFMNTNPNLVLNICKYGLFFSIILASLVANCQDITSPRFFKLNVERLSAPTRLISSEGAALRASDTESNYLIEGQLRYPIKLKGRTKFIGAIDYDREAVFGDPKGAQRTRFDPCPSPTDATQRRAHPGPE